MKKLCVLLMALCLCIGLCACDSSDYKKAVSAFQAGDYQEARDIFAELGDYEDSALLLMECDYIIACRMLETGDYQEARTIFEKLGDYEDSAEKILECETYEIDEILQGAWYAIAYDVMRFDYSFDDGRYQAELTVNDNAITNEGSYRIDASEKAIYILFDYTINMDGSKTPNTEEEMLFTFTYEDGVLEVFNNLDEKIQKA